MRASPDSFRRTRRKAGDTKRDYIGSAGSIGSIGSIGSLGSRIRFRTRHANQPNRSNPTNNSNLRGELLRALADLEASEASDGDVLAELGDRGRDERADRDLGVANRRLVEQAHLLVEAIELAF